MVNSKILLNMYEKYIDNDILHTPELIKLGLNKNDLTKLVSDGDLVRPKKGQYAIGNVEGLLYYSKIRFGKRNYDDEKAKRALRKASLMEPNNGKVQTGVFLNSIFEGDLNQALRSFKVMDETENLFYKQDQNLWIYLLSFIIDLPYEYMETVQNITYDKIKVLDDDKRYPNKKLQEDIRKKILDKDFKQALELSRNIPLGDRRVFCIITEALLCSVIKEQKNANDSTEDIINNCDYSKLKVILEEEKNKHPLSEIDESVLICINDLEYLNKENKKIIKDSSTDENNIFSCICSKNYLKALELSDNLLSSSNYKNQKDLLLNKLLKEIVDKDNDLGETECYVIEKSKKKIDSVGNNLFTNIMINLTNNNIKEAKLLINEYLIHLSKKIYKEYIYDLLQISILTNDKVFTEAMEALSDLSKNEFEFNSALYIQNFYYNLARKKFEEASLYLDILSMSKDLGGIEINIFEMKNRLIEDASYNNANLDDLKLENNNLEEEEIDLPSEKVISVTEVMDKVGDSNNTLETNKKFKKVKVDMVDEILNNTNYNSLIDMPEEDFKIINDSTISFLKFRLICLKNKLKSK